MQLISYFNYTLLLPCRQSLDYLLHEHPKNCLAYALLAGPIQVMIAPSSVQQVTTGMVTATTNYITADFLSYPGVALFGALIGLFGPSA